MREIATLAEVNVAAINYHFGNKEALYSATIGACFLKMNTEINSIYKDGMTINELTSQYYDFLLNNKEDLITSFKLFLDIKNAPLAMHEDDKSVGPPGGSIFYKCLKAMHPKAKDADLFWAVRTSITQIIHTALIICNHSDTICENTGMSEDDMKKSLLRTIRVVEKEISV